MHIGKLQLAVLQGKSLSDRRRIVEGLCGRDENIRDPRWWAQPTSFQRENGNPFHFDHQKLVRMASRRRPRDPGCRVTDFSKWVFSLYAPPPNNAQLTRGKEIERQIAKYLPAGRANGWRLVFEDPLDEATPGKVISSLTVKGAPLRGVPDLVFENSVNGEIVIIERKTSHRPTAIVSDGWPNLRAQLWAYSKIDEYVRAPSITLVGEVWGYAIGMRDRVIRKRASLIWRANDSSFDRQNRELFEIYNASQSGEA